MRKIGTSYESEKRRKRNTIIVSSFLLVILFGSIVGYGFLSNPSSQSSAEDGDIQNVGDYWITNIGTQRFYFSSSPNESNKVPYYVSISLDNYVNRPLYIVSDNDKISQEIALNLGPFAERVQPACYGECEWNFPEKDCTENLIIWKDSEINTVYQEDNCIFIEGDMVAVDAFLYRVLNIIE